MEITITYNYYTWRCILCLVTDLQKKLTKIYWILFILWFKVDPRVASDLLLFFTISSIIHISWFNSTRTVVSPRQFRLCWYSMHELPKEHCLAYVLKCKGFTAGYRPKKTMLIWNGILNNSRKILRIKQMWHKKTT